MIMDSFLISRVSNWGFTAGKTYFESESPTSQAFYSEDRLVAVENDEGDLVDVLLDYFDQHQYRDPSQKLDAQIAIEIMDWSQIRFDGNGELTGEPYVDCDIRDWIPHYSADQELLSDVFWHLTSNERSVFMQMSFERGLVKVESNWFAQLETMDTTKACRLAIELRRANRSA